MNTKSTFYFFCFNYLPVEFTTVYTKRLKKIYVLSSLYFKYLLNLLLLRNNHLAKQFLSTILIVC